MPKKAHTERIKNSGRVYTPVKIVDAILDLTQYVGSATLQRHVVDNSCGDGAFLTRVVRRYCEAAKLARSRTLRSDLETYIHGIELDQASRDSCVAQLDEVAAEYGARNVRWDVLCADALTVSQYDGKMDYVLGNPPYVRVHNLGVSRKSVRSYEFAQVGMTDLYLVFYEIGRKMLNSRGKLGYITPSSFFNSVAGKSLRHKLVAEKALKKLVDMKHEQVFSAATYTTIVVIEKGREDDALELYDYDRYVGPRYVDTLRPADYYFNDKFYFGRHEELSKLKEILKLGAYGDRFEVKNGFATLADKFFIADDLDLPHTIPVVKASTGKTTRCLFPYEDGIPLPESQLFKNKALAEYYHKYEVKLKSRSLISPQDWTGYGRTQGVNDVARDKCAVNTLIRDKNDVKLTPAPAGTGVYSGLYILSDLTYDQLQALLVADDFANYVAALMKYKAGGYYAFSSKDLKTYLEYASMQL